MNTMDEIAGRLGAIEEKTKEVVADLEELGSIQRSLEGSKKTLTAVNAHVTEIAQTARSTVDGLNDAVTTFREAIEVIRRSDPQVVKNSLERLETENQRILTKLDAVDEFASDVRTLRALVEETAETARSTVDGLNDAVTTFREAIEVIRRSDLQVVKNSLERLETENQRILTKLDAVDELASDVRTLRALVEETAEKSDGNTRSTVEWAVERLGGQNLFDRMLGRTARS